LRPIGPKSKLFVCLTPFLPPSPAFSVLQVRAKQYYSDDVDRTANMPILLHGDGAFAGAPLLSSLWLR
jgi:hypothetical protein